MSLYMHKETGIIDTADGWIASYTAEELAERGLEAIEAFFLDCNVTLFETKEGHNA